MSTTGHVFFANSGRREIVAQAASRVRLEFDGLGEDSDEKTKFLLHFIAMTLGFIKSEPKLFDQYCTFNIDVIGDKFIDEIKNISMANEDLEYVFSSCYRFIIECQISSPGRLTPLALEALERASDFKYEFVASQIRYAEKEMVINILQQYIHHPKLASLKSLPDVIDKANIQYEDIEKDMAEREARVEVLAKKLDSYRSAFNFVGLYAGFEGMRSDKVLERRVNFLYLLVLGVLLLLPFALKITTLLKGIDVFRLDTVGLVTLAGLEFLLLYFFRLALQNFRSIKAQLLQIDLRMTLCQFIQSYADYSKEVRASNSAVLDRFEQIVFSGIVNDESAIPSTFDGLDKVADLINKIRK